MWQKFLMSVLKEAVIKMVIRDLRTNGPISQALRPVIDRVTTEVRNVSN